jgi:hypothetical protein
MKNSSMWFTASTIGLMIVALEAFGAYRAGGVGILGIFLISCVLACLVPGVRFAPYKSEAIDSLICGAGLTAPPIPFFIYKSLEDPWFLVKEMNEGGLVIFCALGAICIARFAMYARLEGSCLASVECDERNMVKGG